MVDAQMVVTAVIMLHVIAQIHPPQKIHSIEIIVLTNGVQNWVNVLFFVMVCLTVRPHVSLSLQKKLNIALAR